jgi:hypothetical protein
MILKIQVARGSWYDGTEETWKEIDIFKGVGVSTLICIETIERAFLP